MNWNTVGKDIEKGPLGLFKQIFIFGLLIGVTVVTLAIIFKPTKVLEQVANPAAIVYKYEYFYNQAEAYRAITRKIIMAKKSIVQFKEDAGFHKDWTFEDKIELSRLRSIADGLAYQCNDIVADYNAKAQQVTRSIFKTNSTPYRLMECK